MTNEERFKCPLAFRMRPCTLDEFFGQEHLTGSKGILRFIVSSRVIPSLILWGPPGSGKTSIAHILSKSTDSEFISLSAVTSSIREVKNVMSAAKRAKEVEGRRTVLFIDEIHRFNKAQQDAFLPYIENGTIVLIGATIENPSFYVIPPLLSRTTLIRLYSLGKESLNSILTRALADKEKGLGMYGIRIKEDARDFLIGAANGDARVMLNALETAASITNEIDISTVMNAYQTRGVRYDKKGEEHYNLISAFIKSIRGSDPDAAVYWLVRMIDSGEDPLFIARRMIICASEDIGNADPNALQVAVSAYHAFQYVGLPEGEIPLAHAAIYLACTPKSNAVYKAIKGVRADISRYGYLDVPKYLKNPITGYLRKVGYGEGYKYPHDYPGHFVKQDYLPFEIKGHKYYLPTDLGMEKAIKRKLAILRGGKEK